MEIELSPDPGADDPARRAALTALAGELGKAREGEDGWRLVPHSVAWRRAAVSAAVARTDGLEGDRGPGDATDAHPD